MKTVGSIAILMIVLSTACKKKYSCECSGPGGVYSTTPINDTKRKAKQKCADINKEQQTMPWSEINCSLK